MACTRAASYAHRLICCRRVRRAGASSAQRKFLVLPLTNLTADDLASNADTGLHKKVRPTPLTWDPPICGNPSESLWGPSRG